MMKLIVGKYCAKCKVVEDHIDKRKVEILDVDSVDAMTLFAFNEMMGKPISTPLLFTDDTNYITDVHDIIRTINEVKIL